jgi:Rieske Fe-S protein
VVRCSALVVATNTPVNDRVVIHTKQSGYRTYVMAFDQVRGAEPAALWWDTGTAYHYVRLDGTTAAPGRQRLIVGGEDHRTGQDHDASMRWDRLEAWTRDRFPGVGRVTHRWSGQVMEPVDDLAFVGRNPADAPGVFVITGDSGNGMTHCTLGAMILAELVQGRPHPWAELYDPRRRTLRALPTYVRDAVATSAQYGDWLSGVDVSDTSEIPIGHGATMFEGGHRLAVYKDPSGFCHRMRAACTHLGGVVGWNAAERSWDCPCHGARYDPYGAVIMGPACKDLRPVPPQEAEIPIEQVPHRIAATPRF